MVLKRHVLSEVTVPYGLEKEGKSLGADEAWSNDLVTWADRDLVGNEVQESRSIYHVTGHASNLTRLPEAREAQVPLRTDTPR